jgi:hypothetical protein
MDFFGSYVNTGSVSAPSGEQGYNMYIFAVIGVILALVIWAVASIFWNRSKTMPTVQGFEDAQQVDISGAALPPEGFFGGVAVGAGEPDCLRTSSEAAQVYSIFANRRSSTEEGPADFQEFRLLLSKLACFKKDLIGTAAVVEATRYQPYATSMDIEPIGETTARCFAKTIPSRDLEISLDKWSKRGKELIRRLCTSMNLTEMESAQADTLFDGLIRDVSDVARSVCLSGEPTINGKVAPRQPNGFEPETLSELGPYKGYY